VCEDAHRAQRVILKSCGRHTFLTSLGPSASRIDGRRVRKIIQLDIYLMNAPFKKRMDLFNCEGLEVTDHEHAGVKIT
jgi:hypothetical protein